MKCSCNQALTNFIRFPVSPHLQFRPTVFDPSELRTDVTGKVVRYLQDNGAPVEVGQPFVEVEAMKMIMPIKASESGKITHNLSPGSVISAGDLLATLELKDPSKVKKIITFEGALDFPAVPLETNAKEMAANLLAGFKVSLIATFRNVGSLVSGEVDFSDRTDSPVHLFAE